MLYREAILNGYALKSLDGEIGKVKEFYFDDTHWTIRYLVAETGNWLTNRQVLLSPYALTEVLKEEKLISVNVTKKQIEGSPSLNSDKPVSRQFEEAYYSYYRWPMYWGGPFMWGAYPYIVRDHDQWKAFKQKEKTWNPHLRSTHVVHGYAIQATDGDIGHISDFIIEDTTWAIRYLIVDTHNWWPGKKVLISPKWINSISWDDSKVSIYISRAAVTASPEYTGESMLTREYELSLHKHYDRSGYWIDNPIVEEHVL